MIRELDQNHKSILRFCIAESVGWKHVSSQSLILGINKTVWIRPNDDESHGFEPPYYADDLNAMRDAEIWLRNKSSNQKTDRLWNNYRSILEHIAGPLEMAHATASQRSEAFMKALSTI